MVTIRRNAPQRKKVINVTGFRSFSIYITLNVFLNGLHLEDHRPIGTF